MAPNYASQCFRTRKLAVLWGGGNLLQCYSFLEAKPLGGGGGGQKLVLLENFSNLGISVVVFFAENLNDWPNISAKNII